MRRIRRRKRPSQARPVQEGPPSMGHDRAGSPDGPFPRLRHEGRIAEFCAGIEGGAAKVGEIAFEPVLKDALFGAAPAHPNPVVGFFVDLKKAWLESTATGTLFGAPVVGQAPIHPLVATVGIDWHI